MKSPLKAIKAYCRECSGGSSKEVQYCPIGDCELYQYRFGKREKKEVDRVQPN